MRPNGGGSGVGGGGDGGAPELTVLDLLQRAPGRSEREAVADTLELAERAEGFGYARFWLAEHQGAASPALGCPELLVGPAARTRRLRVGTAGVLLRYYSPLKVAETFRCLEALHPGRIDLGVARGAADVGLGAPLLDGRPEPADAAAYRAKVGQLLHFLGTPDGPGGPGAPPAPPTRPARWPAPPAAGSARSARRGRRPRGTAPSPPRRPAARPRGRTRSRPPPPAASRPFPAAPAATAQPSRAPRSRAARRLRTRGRLPGEDRPRCAGSPAWPPVASGAPPRPPPARRRSPAPAARAGHSARSA